MKIFLILLTLFLTLSASHVSDEEKIKKMIGRMLIVGFDGTDVDKNSQIVKDIQKYDLGGVILFDKDYKNRKKTKNIKTPQQLKKLTKDLERFANKALFISIDQEGGKVARLKPKYGFVKIPSASKVAKMNYEDTLKIYETQSEMLEENGINMNFAPVVDLAINPKNRVIVGLERSFGEDPRKVVEYAKVVIDEQRKHHIISVLKHFPGHGSSFGDSHKGFVDISETWTPKELEPYYELLKEKKVDAIMSAHVFNKHIDDKYPATLSYKFNTKLLRDMMHYNGVIISDDMQMGAISNLYSLKARLKLAINSGIDIVLFGNQLAKVSVSKLVNTIYEELKSGEIPFERIIESNIRINNLLTKNSIVQKPILFGEKRKSLTIEYIKRHYGLNVHNIKINPKIIVLHWTAVNNFKDSFKRLNQEKLYSDRADIAKASSLNVSAHYLIDRDGTIYQLIPDNIMARHVIGLNYSSIGIENVGGEGNIKEDLTNEQLKSNIALVKYLKSKYPQIEYLIAHYEYKKMQNTKLWLEKDSHYRTSKNDPGVVFMTKIRKHLKMLGLKSADE